MNETSNQSGAYQGSLDAEQDFALGSYDTNPKATAMSLGIADSEGYAANYTSRYRSLQRRCQRDVCREFNPNIVCA